MFSGIANYFFGSNETQETQSPVELESTSVKPRGKSQSPSHKGNCNFKISPADNEWLLVDKSRGGSTQGVEVGFMENLLIEHPSMSVYGPRGRQGSSGVESDRESLSDAEENGVITRSHHRRLQVHRDVHRPTRRSGRALSLREAPSPQHVVTRAAQIAHRQHNRQYNRSQLQRHNNLPRHNEKKCHRQRLHQPSSPRQKVTSHH